MEKPCSKCREIKKIDCFHKRKDCLSGVGATCKACEREKGKRWRSERADHCKEYSKNKYSKKKVEILNKQKQKYLESPEKFLRRTKEWKDNNLERCKITSTAWRRNNPEKVQAAKARRRAKEVVHPTADHRKIEKIYRVCCLLSRLTKTKFQVDHIVPLFWGGIHHESNLQIIPSNINKLKGRNLNFRHSKITHFTDLPQAVLDLHPHEVIESLFEQIKQPLPSEETSLQNEAETSVARFFLD